MGPYMRVMGKQSISQVCWSHIHSTVGIVPSRCGEEKAELESSRLTSTSMFKLSSKRMKQIQVAVKLVFFVRWLGSALEGGDFENPEGL